MLTGCHLLWQSQAFKSDHKKIVGIGRPMAPSLVVAADSLSTFRRLLKRFFIPTIISWCSFLTSPNQWSLQWLCHWGHFKNWLIDWSDWLIDWFSGSANGVQRSKLCGKTPVVYISWALLNHEVKQPWNGHITDIIRRQRGAAYLCTKIVRNRSDCIGRTDRQRR